MVAEKLTNNGVNRTALVLVLHCSVLFTCVCVVLGISLLYLSDAWL